MEGRHATINPDQVFELRGPRVAITSWWWMVYATAVKNDVRLQRSIWDGDYAGSGPLSIRVEGGRRPPEMFNCGEAIVSAALLAELKSFQTGELREVPIQVLDRSEQRVLSNDYVWIRAQPGCGPTDRRSGSDGHYAEGVTREDRAKMIGIPCDLSTWNGRDVFCPSNEPTTVFVTARVATKLAEVFGERISLRRIDKNHAWQNGGPLE